MRVLTVTVLVSVLAAGRMNSPADPIATIALANPFTDSPEATGRLLAELDLEGVSRLRRRGPGDHAAIEAGTGITPGTVKPA